MKLGDLLSNSMVGFLQDSTAENNGAVSLKILRGNSGDADPHLLTIPNNQSLQDFLLIHDIQLRHARDELAIQCENDISLLETVDIRCESCRRAVHLANHEELMARRIGLRNLLNPLLRDAHDASLAHLHHIALHVQDTELGGDTLLDLGSHREQRWGSKTKVVLDILVRAWSTFTEVIQPKSLHDTILTDQHTVSALSAQSSVHSDGIQVDSAVARG
jgi:hypothetical protein